MAGESRRLHVPRNRNSDMAGLWGAIFSHGPPQGTPYTAGIGEPTSLLHLPLEIRFHIYNFAMVDLPKEFIMHDVQDSPLQIPFRMMEQWPNLSVEEIEQGRQSRLEYEKAQVGKVPQPHLSTAILSSNTLLVISFVSRQTLYESMLIFLQRTRIVLYSGGAPVDFKLADFLRQFSND